MPPDYVIHRIPEDKNHYWTRIRLDGEKEDMSHLWIVDLPMRVGSAVVRIGGVAGVGTKEEYRNRGLARRVLDNSLEYMSERGFDLTGLFGIRNFYERWDYSQAIPVYRLRIETDALDGFESSLRASAYAEEHREAFAALYNANNALKTGTIVRELPRWEGIEKGTNWDVEPEIVLLMDDDALNAYVVVDKTDERTRVAELGYRSREAFPSLAATLAERARRHGHEEISFVAPPDEPFAVWLRVFGCRADISYEKSGGGMFRILHLIPTFEKILPELQSRMENSALHHWTGRLKLRTDIGSVCLEADRGRLSLEQSEAGRFGLWAEIPQSRLTQLILGYFDIETVAAFDGVKVAPEAVPLLKTLFPCGCPFMWWSDRF